LENENDAPDRRYTQFEDHGSSQLVLLMHGRRVLYFKLHVQCARAHKTISRPQVVHPCSSPKKFYLGNWGYACMTSTQLKAFLQLI